MSEKIKCSRCKKEKEEFVPELCSGCYLEICSELTQKHYRELREAEERKKKFINLDRRHNR